jgi:drug/metabolite transporter (DMT)-like permease
MADGAKRILGAFCLLLAAAIWGGMYVVSKYVLDYIPPMTLLLLRLVIGGATLLLVMLASGTPWVHRRDLFRMALLGLVGFGISLTAQFVGTRLSSAGHGAVITSVTPAFILVFAVALLKERITWAKVAAVAIATAGALLVVEQREGFGPEARVFWGDVFLLVAGITWALYTVLGRLATRVYPAVTVTTYATLFGILWVLPAVPVELQRHTWQPLGAAVWWGTLYLGVVSTALAFYLWNKGFTLMDAATGSLFFFAQPVVGAVLGWWFLGEILTTRFLLGTTVVIAGGVLATRQEGGNSQTAKTPRTPPPK